MANFGVRAFILSCISASLIEAGWDGLGVYWNKDMRKFPNLLPRTTAEAKEQGWYQEGKSDCAASNGYYGLAWHHMKYYPAVNLLFDVKGYIAGMQVGIEFSQVAVTGYPIESQTPPFIMEPMDSGSYVISVYFIDPKKICGGRTEQEFQNQGTGTELYIHNGSSIVQIPKKQSAATHPWVKGTCRITLGHHYWYDINESTRAESYFPLFLLYNGGDLNGFGFYFIKNLRGPVYEACNNILCPLYVESIPRAFQKEPFSFVHVFLDKQTSLNFC